MSSHRRRDLTDLLPGGSAPVEGAHEAARASAGMATGVGHRTWPKLLRAVIAGALTLVVVVVEGCSHGPQVRPGSLVSDSGALIDFRSMPTRTQVGMGLDGFVSYPRRTGGAPVPTTLTFPHGTIHRDFSSIDIGTNYAFASDPDLRHQPTDFDFYLRVDDITQARTVLTEDAAAFGLSPDEVADVTSQGTSVEQGFVESWLSTELEARASGNADGSMNLIYSVTIGYYHNAAVDKVLHDGQMNLDLTTRPTPADLAFRDSYDSADITPEFGHQLYLTLTTPRGHTTLPADSIGSVRANGTVTTTVFTGSTDFDDGPETVRSAAEALDFDVAPALDIIGNADDTLQTRNLQCASTDVYTCAIRVQTFDDGDPHYGFNYRITLTYR